MSAQVASEEMRPIEQGSVPTERPIDMETCAARYGYLVTAGLLLTIGQCSTGFESELTVISPIKQPVAALLIRDFGGEIRYGGSPGSWTWSGCDMAALRELFDVVGAVRPARPRREPSR